MLKLTLAAFLLATDLSPAHWQTMEATAPLDGDHKIAKVILSTNSVDDGTGRPRSAMLMLKCARKQLTVSLAWSGASFGGENAVVQWRGDASPIVTEQWIAAPESAFIAGKNAAPVLDRIAGSKKMVFRASSYGVSQDAVFDVGDGAEDAVAAVRAGCPAQS